MSHFNIKIKHKNPSILIVLERIHNKSGLCFPSDCVDITIISTNIFLFYCSELRIL